MFILVENMQKRTDSFQLHHKSNLTWSNVTKPIIIIIRTLNNHIKLISRTLPGLHKPTNEIDKTLFLSRKVSFYCYNNISSIKSVYQTIIAIFSTTVGSFISPPSQQQTKRRGVSVLLECLLTVLLSHPWSRVTLMLNNASK